MISIPLRKLLIIAAGILAIGWYLYSTTTAYNRGFNSAASKISAQNTKKTKELNQKLQTQAAKHEAERQNAQDEIDTKSAKIDKIVANQKQDNDVLLSQELLDLINDN